MDYRIIQGDCREALKILPDQSVQCIVTSPPYYGLRDYGVDGQIGLEETPEAYVANMTAVFREAWRVLRDDGTLWLNIGDSYSSGGRKSYDSSLISTSGLTNNSAGGKRNTPEWAKPKDLLGIPWRVAFALQADGWYLRQDIIWHKPNPMPESVTDRCTKAHEYIFLLSKNAQYFYDHEAIKEASVDAESYTGRKFRGRRAIYESGCIPTHPQTIHKGNEADGKTYERRNKRDVWTVQLRPFRDAHFATFPPDLIEPCILAGSRQGDTVLDPFNGAGTTGLVSMQHGRKYIGCELNQKYIDITVRRLNKYAPLFTGDQL